MQTGTPGSAGPSRDPGRAGGTRSPEVSPSEIAAPSGGRSYRRERREGVRAVRGLLIAAAIAAVLWAAIGAVAVAVVIAVAR